MAEDLSNIFESYENKSIEELGSSLLSRQAAINEKRAKEAKKSKKIGQALAVIGVGQQLFKNSYNKRMKEADKHELFYYLIKKIKQSKFNSLVELWNICLKKNGQKKIKI